MRLRLPARRACRRLEHTPDLLSADVNGAATVWENPATRRQDDDFKVKADLTGRARRAGLALRDLRGFEPGAKSQPHVAARFSAPARRLRHPPGDHRGRPPNHVYRRSPRGRRRGWPPHGVDVACHLAGGIYADPTRSYLLNYVVGSAEGGSGAKSRSCHYQGHETPRPMAPSSFSASSATAYASRPLLATKKRSAGIKLNMRDR